MLSGIIQNGSTTLNCTASNAGSLRFNYSQRVLEFCDGSVWLAIVFSGKGYDKLNPGLTCLDILKSGKAFYLLIHVIYLSCSWMFSYSFCSFLQVTAVAMECTGSTQMAAHPRTRSQPIAI